MESPGKIPDGREGAADTGMIAAESEIESVYDTVAPIAPCYRRGAVLQAVSTSGGVKEPIVRDAFQAHELGLELLKQTGAIDKAVAEVIRATGKALGVPVASLKLIKGPVRSRFAPGLILDFPSHEFKLGSLFVRERTCVTVCYNQAASKIWIRFVGRNGGGEAISEMQLVSYFRFCEQAARNGIEAVRAIYFDKFKAQLGRKSVAFEELGEIDFIGLDTECLHFDDLLYSDSVGIVADASQISPERRSIFASFFRDRLGSFFPGRFKDSDINGISEHKVSAFRSEFAYRALYHGVFRDDSVTFLVLSEPGNPVPNPYYERESGALTVISELAARAMTKF